jgi:hypothetical protein
MSNSDQTTEFFGVLARVLLRSWIFGFVVLYAWFGMILLAKEPFYGLIGNWFGLSNHEMDLANLCGIALLKLLLIVFFFFPWLSIRLMLRGRKA